MSDAASELRVSWVRDATSTETQDAGALKLIESIRLDRRGKLRGPIEKIRRLYQTELAKTGDRKAAKKAVAAEKKNLLGVQWSGRFRNREKPTHEKLISHSGLLCADLDELGNRREEVRAKLLRSPHLWVLFLSPTGEGLKAVFRVAADADKHHASYLAVRAHVEELTGVRIDETCKDVARLCFMSFDPDAYCNPDAVELAPIVEPAKPAHGSVFRAGTAEIETRRCIAIELLGPVEWQDQTSGFVRCPGEHLHTNSDGRRDCEVLLDGVPTIRCFHNSCCGLVKAANHTLRSRIGKAENASWGEPKPLPADIPAVPAFPFDCLPATLRPWIEDIAERMQCPPDFPAVGAMAALGAIVGRKIGVRPKRHDDWLVVPNLWGCIVGRPGLMKTPALEQALIPLRRLVAEALDKYKAAMREHGISAMLKKGHKKLSEVKIEKHLKDGDEQAARAEAKAAAGAGDNEPVLRRYEVNDSTVAKIGELLAQNSNGLLIHRDELVGFLRALDKDGNEEARAFYLESWNGTGSFTFDRIGRGTVHVESNTLSLLGGIQPDLLAGYIREAVRGGAGADGLLQRFQLAVWPDVSKEWRNVDRWPDTKAKNEAFAVFKHLDELTPAAAGADTTGSISFLRFTEEAQGRFDTWRGELERKLRSDSEHPAFEAHLAKYRSLVPALALLIHLANRETGLVSLAALEKALLWARYLEAHARRIYSAVLRPDTAAARELAKHLQRGELPTRFTLRETYRHGWAGLSSKDDAEAATEILCELGWIRGVPVQGGGKTGRPPSPSFETNPKILNPLTERPDTTDTTNSGSSGGEHPGVSENSCDGGLDGTLLL